MFGKFSNTWSLMGDSWELLKQDKELLLFPLISGICCIIVVASFAIPMIVNESYMPPAADETGQVETADQVAYYAKLFLFYFCNYLVIIFFNSAIVGCVAMRMQGNNPTIADGFRIAFSRMPLIVGWALIAATVGLILRIIEDKNEKIGRFIAGLLGIAWTMVSFLVLPVMVIEKKDPFAALKESTAMLKRTWGQQIIGNFSFGLVFFLLFLPGIVVVVLGVMSQNPAVMITCIILAVVYFIVLSLIQSTLQVIFQTALYYYAKDGTAPAGFDTATLGGAIGQK
jgi:hypothetical protein